MTISFVIPAYNQERYLGRTLERLIESAEGVGEAYEIIVVADGCTDGTAAVARQHGTRVLEVELRHIAAVRNAGARLASGELLIFVDADTLVPQATLAATVRTIRNGAGGGGARPVIDPPIPWWFVVLREPMITSGRKIEEMSTWEGICTSTRLVLRGRKALRRREGLEIWYDQRTPHD